MLLDVIEAKYIKDFKIKIKFENNEEGVVDFHDFISEGGIFSPLRNIKNFKKFYVNNDLGTICWPNGADIAPETLYLKIKK